MKSLLVLEFPRTRRPLDFEGSTPEKGQNLSSDCGDLFIEIVGHRENAIWRGIWNTITCMKAAILLCIVAVLSSNQSPAQDQGLTQNTPTGGYWVDQSTGLMWAAKDNGKDISWKGAVKYCRNLRLAGYSDWRLATLAELRAIFDLKAEAPGLAGSGKDNFFAYHVKGNLFLTGDEWSSERISDDRGHPSAYAWYFDFNEGRSNDDPTGFLYPHSLMRALCVRSSGK